MSLLLVFVAAPTVLAMTVWVSVTAVRLLKPLDPVLHPMDPVLVQMARMPVRGSAVAVGDGDTPAWFPGRDTWREFHHARYDYSGSRSDGLPEAWWEDVLRRQN